MKFGDKIRIFSKIIKNDKIGCIRKVWLAYLIRKCSLHNIRQLLFARYFENQIRQKKKRKKKKKDSCVHTGMKARLDIKKVMRIKGFYDKGDTNYV